MKSMTRIILFVLAALLVVSLAACGKSDDVSLIGKWKLDMDDYYEKVRAYGVSDEQIQEVKEIGITVIDEFTEDGEYIRIITRKNDDDDYDMMDWNYEIVDGRIVVSEHGSVKGFKDYKINGNKLELTDESGVTLSFTRVK